MNTDARSPERVGALLVLGGGLLVIIGVFTPWVVFQGPIAGTVTATGMDAAWNGDVILSVAVVGLVMGGVVLTGRVWSRWASAAAAFALAALVLLDLRSVSARVAEIADAGPQTSASVGFGVWAMLVGVGLMCVGAVGMLWLPRSSNRSDGSGSVSSGDEGA